VPHSHAGGSGRASRRTRILLAAVVAPFVAATVIGLLLLWPDRTQSLDQELGAGDFYRGRVTSVGSAPCKGSQGPVDLPCKAFEVDLREGPDAGETVNIEIVDEPNAPDVQSGDQVIVGHSPDAPRDFRYFFSDHERRPWLLGLGILFAFVVVGFGRLKGLAALAGFALSLGLIIFFVLPAILEGQSPLLVAIVGGSAVMLGALYLAHGINARTTSAVLGTFASLGLTGLLALAFVEVSRLTGFSSEEALQLNIEAGQVNLRGLVLAGIIIGALGVLDDVTITQASAVWELRLANPAYGFSELYRSAIRIGRDHIASAVNTLLLAYAGASLPLLILFTLVGTRVGTVINSEVVAQEVVRTLVGSIGLIASVPITTALAAAVISRDTEGPS
jgi:uncharacterized membrane protein